MLDSFAQWCLLAHGWRRLLVAFAAGALAAFSMPPLYILPTLFIAFPILVWLLDGVEGQLSWRQKLFGPAFRIGWGFGFGYFTFSLHWMSGAFFVEPDLFLWLCRLVYSVCLQYLPFFLGRWDRIGTSDVVRLWPAPFLRSLAL